MFREKPCAIKRSETIKMFIKGKSQKLWGYPPLYRAINNKELRVKKSHNTKALWKIHKKTPQDSGIKSQT